MGSREFINKINRYCFWLSKDDYTEYASKYLFGILRLMYIWDG